MEILEERERADLDISLFAPSAPSRSLRRFSLYRNSKFIKTRGTREDWEREGGKGEGTENENKVRMWELLLGPSPSKATAAAVSLRPSLRVVLCEK